MCAVWCVFLVCITTTTLYGFVEEKKIEIKRRKKNEISEEPCDRRSVKVIVVEATTAWKHAYLRIHVCVHAAAVRSTGPAAATSGKSYISHAKRKVFGRKTAPPGPARRRPTTTTTFPFYKTIIIRVHPSRVFSSLHGSRVIHHLRVVVDVLVIIIIHRGVTCLKYYKPGDSFIMNSNYFKNQ